MPQPVSYNPGTPVSGSIQENNISYVVDGQQRNYRGGFGGLSWMSEVPAENNVIFIGNSTSLGRGPANIPLFYPSYNNSSANIIYAANTLPGSPRNFTATGSAYNWAVTNNFFINNSNNPIPRIDADGLSLYLDASQPTSYPQTGTTWYDVSGIGTNGTLTNGATYVDEAIRFDGVDDQVSANNVSVSYLSSSTVDVIFKVGGYSGAGKFALAGYNFNGGGYSDSTTGIIYIYDGGTIASSVITTSQVYVPVYSTTTVVLGRYYHATLYKDTVNGVLKLYVNGNLENTNNFNTATYGQWPSPGTYIGNDDFAIGWYNSNNWGSGPYFSGSIASAKLYGKLLTETEIKQNYFQSNIVTDGLVFMVDANNLVSYEDGSTTTYSLTGSFTGNLQNGVSFLPNNGGVFNFDGVDDFIQVPYDSYWDSNVFGTATNFTIECWYKPDLFMNWDSMIWKQNPSVGGWYSSPEGASIWSDANGFQAVFASGVASNPVGSNLVISYSTSTLKWYHLCFTGDGTTLRFYVDGIQRGTDLVANRTVPVTTSSNGPTFGRRDYMNGQLGNSRFYTRGLTASEVQQNYQATKDKFQGQQIVTNGLVLNLDAANKDSYPGTGATWYDLSGNANNGTLLNGVAFNANKNGGVMYFDDTDDTVSIGNSSLFSITNAMTVFAWVNPSSTSGWDGIFGGSISGFVHFQLYFGTINVYIYGPNVSYSNNDSYIVPANVWISIGFTYDGTTLKVYVNGSQLATTIPGSGNVNSNSDVRVGWAYDTSRVFGGYIGTTQVYNRALSATEITQNYNATKVRFGL